MIRAVLHMFQGLAGRVFVRVGAGERTSGNRNVKGVGERGGTRPRREFNSPNSRCKFSLSTWAVNNLAIASLSPGALSSVLGDFVRIGSVAEYLRGFIADAEASTSVAAASRGTLPPHPLAAVHSAQCEKKGECKHGHSTHALAACVRRQLEAFEDVAAQWDRWLYRRQSDMDYHKEVDGAATGWANRNHVSESHRKDKEGSASVETIIGLLSLVRREAKSLDITRELVEAGAGWWVETPPGVGMRPGEGAGGLRERTGRLLTVLHDSLVEGALVQLPAERGQFGIGSEAIAPLRRGWILQVFCEVLAPYLRLVDTWITEGKIIDPHNELFFSQTGGGEGINVERHGGPRAGR